LSAAWKVLVIIGVLVGLFGFVFALQGEGVVGPASSSMYNQSFWVYSGLGIAVVGLVIFLGGLFLASSRAKSMKANR
jgi:ABC-type antimicrobial peptide transport system permease subunit